MGFYCCWLLRGVSSTTSHLLILLNFLLAVLYLSFLLIAHLFNIAFICSSLSFISASHTFFLLHTSLSSALLRCSNVSSVVISLLSFSIDVWIYVETSIPVFCTSPHSLATWDDISITSLSVSRLLLRYAVAHGPELTSLRLHSKHYMLGFDKALLISFSFVAQLLFRSHTL